MVSHHSHHHTNAFDSSKITKYFKNQTPETNLQGQFVDPFFPPNEASLLAKDQNGNWIGDDSSKDAIDSKTVVWRSASQIFDNIYNLFDGKIECDDIKQGSLGNCYFLSSLAALCEYPVQIYNIFRTKEKSAHGYYEICLFIEGHWQIVIVDDYFPVLASNEKSFKFSKPNGKELWSVLLEKAWAKVNGGYRNTIAGKESDALNALTSFPSERYPTNEMSRDELWDLVLQSDKSDNVMCTTTINDPEIEKLGLVQLHAYTLVGAVTVIHQEKETKLVKVRNPWGNTEWTGLWSDKSDVWTDDLKTQAKFENRNDGVFHISFDDYNKYYNYISICAMMPDANIKHLSYKVSKSSHAPRVYNISVREECTLGISVIDRHWRFTREIKNQSIPIYILLAKYEDNHIKFIDGDFCVNTSVDLIKFLKAGNYMLWVWNDFDNSYNILNDNQEKEIKVCFTSNSMFNVKEQAVDSEFEALYHILYYSIIEGKDIRSKEVFSLIENCFKKTGLGYRIIVNNSKVNEAVWNNDGSEIVEMSVFPPYRSEKNATKFEVVVDPESWKIIVAGRTKFLGKYWFNLKSSFKQIPHQPGTSHNTLQDNHFFLTFCNENLAHEEIDHDFYTFTSSCLSNDQPVFKQENLEQLMLDEFVSKYPTQMALLASVPEIEGASGLKWTYSAFKNGFYLGQVNDALERHGKGIYHFSNNTGYYGQWNKNVKQGFGVSYGDSFKKIVEGQFQNGNVSGKAITYCANGDKIDCIYVNGVRDGPGTFYWKNGNRWEGGFAKNQLHGVGKYVMANGNSFTVTFENGVQKK